MSSYRDCFSLREIDQRAGTFKGAAFRRFKGLEAGLQQMVVETLAQAERDREVIDRLRESGRIYASSINVVLLSPETAQRLLDALAPAPQADR
jgi:hypothetical protein